jgi:hypothetical protein
MEIQDIATAREDCRVCISKWQAEMESMKALLDGAPTYSAKALAQSIDASDPNSATHYSCDPGSDFNSPPSDGGARGEKDCKLGEPITPAYTKMEARRLPWWTISDC